MLAEKTDLSLLIKELRLRLNLTQEKLAAKLCVTFPTINRWENGRAKPSPLGLKQIEDLLIKLGDKGKDLHESYFAEKD